MTLILLELRPSHHARSTDEGIRLAGRSTDERPSLVSADPPIDNTFNGCMCFGAKRYFQSALRRFIKLGLMPTEQLCAVDLATKKLVIVVGERVARKATKKVSQQQRMTGKFVALDRDHAVKAPLTFFADKRGEALAKGARASKEIHHRIWVFHRRHGSTTNLGTACLAETFRT